MPYLTAAGKPGGKCDKLLLSQGERLRVGCLDSKCRMILRARTTAELAKDYSIATEESMEQNISMCLLLNLIPLQRYICDRRVMEYFKT